MAFGLDDSDIEDLLESSSSEEDVPAPLHGLSALPIIPTIRAVTAIAAREAQQPTCGDASRGVPANRSGAVETHAENPFKRFSWPGNA